jgi:hypothetical protein
VTRLGERSAIEDGGSAALEVGDEALLRALVAGGDERIEIDPISGRNRYFTNPVDSRDVFNRGSCTAGMLNDRSREVARDFLARYDTLNYASLVEEQSFRLKNLLSSVHKDPFDVFFGPSGTDLAYLPTLFQRLLHPDKPIIQLMSCPEELGSGSMDVAAARLFGRQNQFGQPLEQGAPIDRRASEPTVVELDARDPDGNVLDRRDKIVRLIADNPNAAVVGSLVFGSKSGIKDDLDVIDDYGDHVMWVVDLCQLRVDPALIHELLDHGAMVMLTGSKFFQTPPFCGALLVPRQLTERLRAAQPRDDGSPVAPFGQIFSAHDVPWALDNVRQHLPDVENRGLRLRWQIALDEMESYAKWPFDVSNQLIDEWNSRLTEVIERHPSFRIMPDQHKTNDSIISTQVLAGGRELSHDELLTLYESVLTTEHEGLSGGARRVFFGQPVRYGRRSFIRFAVGAPSVRWMLERGSLFMDDDERLVEIVADYAERLA